MTQGSSHQIQTLLVGIDGACFDVLEKVTVPTIQTIIENGVGSPLRSQLPPWTASAWPSIFTGVNPGKHGVFDFLTFDGYDWDIVNRTHVREYALWELLEVHGLTSVVVNVPVTHPPKPFNGALVPGYVAPDNPECHPEGLLSDIRREIGNYRVYPDIPSDADPKNRVEEYTDLVEMRGMAFRILTERYEPDFGFIQFQQTDTTFHDLPGNFRAVRAVYAAVDREISRIIARHQPQAVFIVSDHGIGEYRGYGVRVNDLLREHGYVETKKGGKGMPSWSSIARTRFRDGVDGQGVSRWLARQMARVAGVGVTSQRLETLLHRLGVANFVVDAVPTEIIRAGTEQVDFPNSLAYMRSRLELGVRINLEGREPEGKVAEENYFAVRQILVELLTTIRTPEGDPVFEYVGPREEVFDGPYLSAAPDIITVPNEFNHLPTAALRGEIFGPPDEPWEHKPQGLFAAEGDRIHSRGDLKGPHLFDIAPTVLASLGVPFSDRMDGGVLDIVESAGNMDYGPYEAQPSRGTDDSDIEGHLADLGYIE